MSTPSGEPVTTPSQAADVSDNLDDDLDDVTPPPSPSDATPPSPAPAGTPPGQVPGSGAPSQPLSARDWAAAQGFEDAKQYGDDAAFLQALMAGHRSGLQQRQAYEARIRDLEALAYVRPPQQPATPPADPLARFKGPQFDPRWMSLVDRDDKGNLVPKPGVDPSIVQKIHDARAWREQFFEDLSRDPAALLQPLIEAQMKGVIEKTEKTVEEKMRAASDDRYYADFLATHKDWLFLKDQQGNFIPNPRTGGYVATAEGQKFVTYLREAQASGITGRAAEKYARALLLGDMAEPILQQGKTQTQGDAAKQAVIDKLNRRNPSQSGSTVASDGTGHQGAQQNSSLSYEDRLKAAMSQVYPRGEIDDDVI